MIRKNQPQYVVLSEERYHELIRTEQEAYNGRVRSALQNVKRGEVRSFKTADDLLKALDVDEIA